MGVKQTPQHYSPKGIVSLGAYKNGQRIRWRHNGIRREIYIPPSIADHNLKAVIIQSIIEQDLLAGKHDETLKRYRRFLKLDLEDLKGFNQHQTQKAQSTETETNGTIQSVPANGPIHVLVEFNRYLAAKSLSLHPEQLSSYYTQTIAMLKKWGDFAIQDTALKLGAEAIGPKTFNDRRNCLFKFFAWMVKKGRIHENPLEEVATKRRERNCEQRKPFSLSEVTLILEALRTDRFKHPSASFSHSQYYPLVAFMLLTGVRNGEAIGLKVKDIIFPSATNWSSGSIRIGRALARTGKGTNISARKEKGTKMNNVRHLPFNQKLENLLRPLCINRNPEEYVFLNQNGNPIDDRMFQRRVFRPVLEKLNIEKRDLYACRHTFATMAVQQGMKPHEVAYIMGDLVETVLENYFHNNRRPTNLPDIIVEIV